MTPLFRVSDLLTCANCAAYLRQRTLSSFLRAKHGVPWPTCGFANGECVSFRSCLQSTSEEHNSARERSGRNGGFSVDFEKFGAVPVRAQNDALTKTRRWAARSR
eukprot:6204781-Pleurochrysis_carterae.AAC.2